MLTYLKLKEEVGHLNSKPGGMTKYVCMLNFGTKNFEKIWGVGKSSKDMKGIRYTSESSNSMNILVTPIQKQNSQCLVISYNNLPNTLNIVLSFIPDYIGYLTTMVDMATYEF